MASYIRSFTFDRNSLKKTARESSEAVQRYIDIAISDAELDKNSSNIIGALRNYLGVINADRKLTAIGEKFLQLYAVNIEDAWRWLLTRALWLYSVPNGTNAKFCS